jgi:hypothetical protein
MKFFKSLTTIAALLLFSFACLAQDKSSGAIRGKVKVEKGSPAGVAVIVQQGNREVARSATDKKGEFVVSHVAAGVYSVKFRKAGLAVGAFENIEVIASKTRALHDIYLPIDEGSLAFIRGSVFTEAGRSVPNVRVELARIVSESSTQKIDARVTGETGEFVFRLPPDNAKYRLTLKADGIQPESKEVEVESAVVYRVALTLRPVPKS